MMRTAWTGAALALALGLAGGAVAYEPSPAPYRAGVEQVPHSDKPFAGAAEEFRFVVMGDRTGRARARVFERALLQVDGLRPDFILNIGDLIEGNTEDQARIDGEWDEMQGAIEAIGIPFFYVPGNHDLTNDVQRAAWRRRLGADYYHFTYKDALFLVLNTEDPPQPVIARTLLLREYGAEAMGRVLGALQGDPVKAEALFASDPRLAELAGKLRASEQVAISADQVAMVRTALAANPVPRWTFVLMHRPAWKVDSAPYREIEMMLADRPHTVLAGHFHRYEHQRRGGRDHIQMGVTGGVPGGMTSDPAVVDHILWVSVADGAPRFTNIRLDGMFGKEGPAAAAAPIKETP